jgi:hypothetical protein
MSDPIIPVTPAEREALFEEAQRQSRISNVRCQEIVAIEGREAWKRADDWARNPGTPYVAKGPSR